MEMNLIKSSMFKSKLNIAVIDSRPIFRSGMLSEITSILPDTRPILSNNLSEFYEDNLDKNTEVIFVACTSSLQDVLIEIKQLSETQSKPEKIIVYDVKDSIWNVSKSLLVNIYGYVSDNFDHDELEQCLTSIISGKKYISPKIMCDFFGEISRNVSKSSTKMSHTEKIVANYLVEGKSVSWIARKTAKKLSTISTQKSKILKKMEVENVIDLAKVLNR